MASMVHEDMDLMTELDGQDVVAQLHVSRDRRVVHVVFQMTRDPGGFLGDLLRIVGNAVEGAEIETIIE